MTRPFADRFVTESALIEGQIIPASLLQDCGHMQAYNSMIILADSGAELTQADLKNWQAMIGGEQHLWGDTALPEGLLGKYRNNNVYIGYTEIGYAKIADEMNDLWDLVVGWTGNKTWLARTPLEQAAIIHHTYERIHPFADGNGRSGRLLAAFYLRRHKQAPVLFTNADKAKAYYPCFPEKSPRKMIEYFKTHQELG